MKPVRRILIFGFLISLLFWTCHNNVDQTSSLFLKELSEKQIGDSKFLISLPKDYAITVTRGEDFSVYYFNPIDSTINASCSGGIYFGNFPSEFGPNNDSCQIEKIKGKILDFNADWKVYNCNGEFSIQTIVDNDNNNGWDERIHAFGNCRSRTDLDKILLIYSTMKKK